jgi:hypothetical protein
VRLLSRVDIASRRHADLCLYSVLSRCDSRVRRKSRSSLAAPLAGVLVGMAGICIILLLYRWRIRQRQRQANALYPEPFNSTPFDLPLTEAGVSRKKASVNIRQPQKFEAGEGMTASKSHGEFLQIFEQYSTFTAGPDVLFGDLSTSNSPSPALVTVTSSQLEETQRELRHLRELVSELRIANNNNVLAGFETASVDTGVTLPPDYTTERGLNETSVISTPSNNL